jgi:predicted GH43/DUF377 family glycosyl hydrolase
VPVRGGAGLNPQAVTASRSPDRDALLVYYGAADAVTAVAEFSLGELRGAMTAPG